MADDQRTRIANIVDAQKPILNYRHCEMVADAVIRELGHQCRHCDCPCPCCGNLLTSPRWKATE